MKLRAVRNYILTIIITLAALFFISSIISIIKIQNLKRSFKKPETDTADILAPSSNLGKFYKGQGKIMQIKRTSNKNRDPR